MNRQPKYLGYADFYSPSDVSMSYTDYLQHREFSDAIQYEISAQTKEMITGNEQALTAYIHQLEQLGEGQAEAAYEVIQAIDALQEEPAGDSRRINSRIRFR